MYLFIDESELYSSEKPQDNIYISGGFFCKKSESIELLNSFRKIKLKHLGNSYIPIKNNAQGFESEGITISKVKEALPKIRSELLDELYSHKIGSIVNMKFVYSPAKKWHKYPFINVIQRFALEIKESKNKKLLTPLVLSDWIDRSEKDRALEYKQMYLNGTDSDNNPVHAGKLRSLNFYPSLTFAITEQDEFLQITDFIIRSWRFVLKKFIKENHTLTNSNDLDLLKQLIKITRKIEDEILQRGLIFEDEIKSTHLKAFRKLIISQLQNK